MITERLFDQALVLLEEGKPVNIPRDTLRKMGLTAKKIAEFYRKFEELGYRKFYIPVDVPDAKNALGVFAPKNMSHFSDVLKNRESIIRLGDPRKVN